MRDGLSTRGAGHRLRLRVKRKKRKAGIGRSRRERESSQRLRLRGGFLGGHFAFGDQVLKLLFLAHQVFH